MGDTLFKMMACQEIGSETVHFYFGFEDCYQWTWWIAMVSLLILIVSFGAVFVGGRRLTKEERADPNKFIYKLCKRFRAEYWYWEFVIFVRRIVIAYFAVGVSGIIYKLVFLFLLMVFIWIQWHHRPFLTSEANQAEFLLLCCLPVVIMAQVLPSSSDMTDIGAIIMSIMVLLPIPLISFFIYLVMNRVWNQYNTDHDQMMKTILDDQDAVQSTSTCGGVVETPRTPESGLEMIAFDVYPNTNDNVMSGTAAATGTGTIGTLQREEGDNESEIDLEISNIQDMIPDIVDLVYEGDGQETTNNGNGTVKHEEKLY